MVVSHSTVAQGILQAHQDGKTLAILFDDLGTLVTRGTGAAPPPITSAIKTLLQLLAEQPRVSVGIVGTCSLAELKSAIAVPNLYYSGCNGLELEVDGTVSEAAGASIAKDLMRNLGNWLEADLQKHPGVTVVRKSLALTIDCRSVSAVELPGVRQTVARILDKFRATLRVFAVPVGFEIVCNLGWTKGTAVRAIVNHFPADTVVPCYAGDDACDVDAFAAVDSLGGFTFGVGDSAPAGAQALFENPERLVSFFTNLAQDLCETPVDAATLPSTS